MRHLQVQATAILVAALLAADGRAQENLPKRDPPGGSTSSASDVPSANQEDELLDGLLGLLDSPEVASKQNSNSAASSNNDAINIPGELLSIKHGMQEIAKQVRSKPEASTNKERTQLVRRLDALIEQLRSSATNNRQSQQEKGDASDQSKAEQQQGEQQSASNQQRSADKSMKGEDAEADDGSTEGERNNQTAGPDGQQPADSAAPEQPANLSDRQLQTGAWGNLPPQLRQRIEARMVDRFLPSYRAKIQAYYKAMMSQPAGTK